jgi:hypothetical protein
MTIFLHGHDKFVTDHNPSVSLNTLQNSCAKIACCSSELICKLLYAGSSIQNARQQFVSLCPPLVTKLRSSSNPTNKNLTQLSLKIQTAHLGNHSDSDTSSYKLFLKMADTICSQNTDVPSCNTLYNKTVNGRRD